MIFFRRIFLRDLLRSGGTSSRTNRCNLADCNSVDLDDVIIIITTGFGECVCVIKILFVLFVFTVFFRFNVDSFRSVDGSLPLGRSRKFRFANLLWLTRTSVII